MPLRLLLDANMSPRTALFLAERFEFDVESLIAWGQGRLTDFEVARTAIEEGRVLLTFDLDFEEIFYRGTQPSLGVIILRLIDERSPAVNRILQQFFEEHGEAGGFESSLTIVSETRVRKRTLD